MVSANHGSSTTLSHSSRQSIQIDARQAILTDEEMTILIGFIENVTTLVKLVKLLLISHPSLERALYKNAERTANLLERLHPDGKILQGVCISNIYLENLKLNLK